jgi:hypothetical protein
VRSEQVPNSQPVFHFKKHSWSKKEGLEITHLEVYTKSKDKPIWSIWTDISNPIFLESVTYGYVPPGFKEETKALPLIAGEICEIYVQRPDMMCVDSFVFDGKKE